MTVALVSLAAVIILLVGYRLARATTKLKQAEALNKANKRMLKALAKAIDKESQLREKLEGIDRIDNVDDLNKLYADLVSGNRDP